MESLGEFTKFLYEKIIGEEAHLSSKVEEVIAKLESGEKGIIVNIPWNEKKEDRYYDKLQIVLLRIKDNRVYFCNPLSRETDVLGEVGGKIGEGPLRRVESSGEESMDLDTFKKLFKSGGEAIISGKDV